MATKRAADLKPGDVVDLTALHPYTYPLRTVARIEQYPFLVRACWVEPVGYHDLIPTNKELTLR